MKIKTNSAVSSLILTLCTLTAANLQAESFTPDLVQKYEAAVGGAKITTANHILNTLNDEEVTDSLIQFDATAHPDTVASQLYFWVGEWHVFNHEFDKAVAFFNQSLDTLGRNNLELKSDNYNELALCYARQGLFSQAIEAATNCIETCELLNDKERLMVATNIIGSIYVMAKQSAEAEQHLLRSLQLAKELKDSVKMAVRYGTLSELYHTLGDDTKALEYAHSAYTLDSLRHDPARMAIRQAQMASPLVVLGRVDEAEQILLQARPVLEQSHNLVSLAICLDQLGYIALAKKQWTEATKRFEQVVAIYQHTGERYGEQKAQWGLYQALRHSDIRSAAEHLERYAELKDTLYQQDVARMTTDFNARYRTSELKRQNESQRLMIWIGAIVIAALAGGVVFLLYTQHLKNKNARMKKQLDKVRDQLLTTADKEFLSRVDYLLDEQFRQCNVNFEQLASELCMTRSQLNLKMRALMDENMRDHVNRIRTEKAKKLIATGEMNISEVARACGIDDVAYFSRFFRKMTGMSPREYKNKR